VKRFAAVVAVMLVAVTLFGAAVAQTPPTLKVTELGRGPVIVLVHTLGGGRMQWMPTARRLLATHHVVMVDLPGHGGSGLPDPFSIEASAEMLAGLLSQYRAESTVVVGQGLGGLLCLVALGEHPDRAKGLIAIDAATKLEQPIPDQQQKYFLEYLDANYEAVIKPMFLAQARDSAEGVVLWAQASQAPAASVKSYIRGLLNFDGSKYIREFKPAFLFVGTDRVWPADKKWEDMTKALGYAEAPPVATRRLAGAGATVWSQQPDSLAALISDFAAAAIARK
jgi:pimeloyl-ACP methyl ester carboxylesterase